MTSTDARCVFFHPVSPPRKRFLPKRRDSRTVWTAAQWCEIAVLKPRRSTSTLTPSHSTKHGQRLSPSPLPSDTKSPLRLASRRKERPRDPRPNRTRLARFPSQPPEPADALAPGGVPGCDTKLGVPYLVPACDMGCVVVGEARFRALGRVLARAGAGTGLTCRQRGERGGGLLPGWAGGAWPVDGHWRT